MYTLVHYAINARTQNWIHGKLITFMSILTLLPAGQDVKTFHSEIINLSSTVYMYIFQPASG